MVKTKRNFVEGPIFYRIFLFAIPLMLTGILQVCYTMADNIVVGRFSGDPNALAAIGCTAALSTLIVNLLFGVAGGVGVVVAQGYGAGRENEVSRAVHTALTFALAGGVFLGIVALIISRPALMLMGTKAEVIDSATLYLRIICCGIPATSIYNFSASIVRSTGDSKTSLYILASTGIVNVLLNLLFVIVFHMGVAGVAIATIISQYISAIAILAVLAHHRNDCFGISPRKYRFDGRLLARMLRLGVPAGIQSSLFGITNVLISSAVNTLPTVVVSAKTIAGTIDGITYTAMNCFHHAALTFIGQNYGARKYKRLTKVMLYTIFQVVAVGVLVAQLELLFARPLAELFIDANDPNREAVIAATIEIMHVVLTFYFMCGIQEVLCGILRGMGYSLSPMLACLVGICGVRILWISVFFPMEQFNSASGVFLSYPLSWISTIVMLLVILLFAFRNVKRSMGGEELRVKESALP